MNILQSQWGGRGKRGEWRAKVSVVLHIKGERKLSDCVSAYLVGRRDMTGLKIKVCVLLGSLCGDDGQRKLK